MLIGRLRAASDNEVTPPNHRDAGVAILEDATGAALVSFDDAVRGLVCGSCFANLSARPRFQAGGVHAVFGVVRREHGSPRGDAAPYREAAPYRLTVRATVAHTVASDSPAFLDTAFNEVMRREER